MCEWKGTKELNRGGYDANTYIHVTVKTIIMCKYYMLIEKLKGVSIPNVFTNLGYT